MPLKLAVLNPNKADTVFSQYEYDHRYIGGHSLGGAMAAVYAAEHDELDGAILCAAYPTKQLDNDDLEVIVYGSEDAVLNREKLSEGQQYASDHTFEDVIEGGNHAQFGNYGKQAGDGEATISAKEQQSLAAAFIIERLQEQ